MISIIELPCTKRVLSAELRVSHCTLTTHIPHFMHEETEATSQNLEVCFNSKSMSSITSPLGYFPIRNMQRLDTV